MPIANKNDLKVGDSVHYTSQHYTSKHNGKAYENGVVKSIPENRDDVVFVVYNCAGRWHEYKNYTAAATRLEDLEFGWRHD